MKINNPIFIIGAPRSGTTILYKLLSKHPQIAWVSGLCNRFPDKPFIQKLFLSLIEYPIIDHFLLKYVNAGEIYKFLEYYCNGFSRPFRDLRADDLLMKNKNNLDVAFSKLITKKRDRLAIKITGWPRIGFIKSIYPDVKFIHILRDGRAVANSLLNEHWWLGYSGTSHWQWGNLSAEYQKEWEKSDNSFIALAGIQWKIILDAFEEAKKTLDSENLIQIKYEDLCMDSIKCFKEISDFCSLEWSGQFEKNLRKIHLHNNNDKWQVDLTPHQQKILLRVTKSHLLKYDYLSE